MLDVLDDHIYWVLCVNAGSLDSPTCASGVDYIRERIQIPNHVFT